MKAVILCGGKGTRLGNLTKEIAKPMLPIGGKPVLQHQIELLKRYRITEIYLIVNHLKESISNYFNDGSSFGVNIHYYVENEPLGTVGGIKAIENDLQETFLVLYGDVMMNMDLQRLLAFHQNKKADATLVLHPNDHPYDSDLVDVNERDQVTAFYSKPHDSSQYYRNLVNAGLYVFEPTILRFLERGKKADFGKDIFPFLIHEAKVFGYNTPEYLKDMGTPDRLEKVEKAYLSKRIELSNLSHQQKAIFLDRDGVINQDETGFISHPEDFHLFPTTAEAIRKINHSPYLAIVVTNQSIIARNMASFDDLQQIHNKMETELGNEKACLDAIYFCPHHPDKGFPEERTEYKVVCNCRKPQPGMIFEAAKRFNINLKESFIIGDSDRDIQAGINSGLTTIAVKSGNGMKSAHVKPDYHFNDLVQAVNFILSDKLSHIFNEVKNHLGKSKPQLIAIGGNTRSGKSTLARFLTQSFEKEEKSVLQINLDNWIIPKVDRVKTKDVFERFDSLKLIKDMQAILKGEKVILSAYHHHPEAKPNEISYQWNGEDVVIIEGVIALSFPQLRGLSNCKIFLENENLELKKRFMHFYEWKGFSADEALNIFDKRKIDEYDIIAQDKQFAHLVYQNILA